MDIVTQSLTFLINQTYNNPHYHRITKLFILKHILIPITALQET
jgi:hypothetical protein